MKNESCLFIGGHSDGKTAIVEPLPAIRCVIPPKPISITSHPASYHYISQNVSFEIYQREIFRSPNKEFILYRIEGMTTEDAFQRLLTHYHPKDDQ